MVSPATGTAGLWRRHKLCGTCLTFSWVGALRRLRPQHLVAPPHPGSEGLRDAARIRQTPEPLEKNAWTRHDERRKTTGEGGCIAQSPDRQRGRADEILPDCGRNGCIFRGGPGRGGCRSDRAGLHGLGPGRQPVLVRLHPAGGGHDAVGRRPEAGGEVLQGPRGRTCYLGVAVEIRRCLLGTLQELWPDCRSLLRRLSPDRAVGGSPALWAQAG